LDARFEIDPRTDGNSVLRCPKSRNEGVNRSRNVEHDAVIVRMSRIPVEKAARRVVRRGPEKSGCRTPSVAYTVEDSGAGLRVLECQALRLRQFGPVAASAASTRTQDNHPHVKWSDTQNGYGRTGGVSRRAH
jgi:hypothetical protein